MTVRMNSAKFVSSSRVSQLATELLFLSFFVRCTIGPLDILKMLPSRHRIADLDFDHWEVKKNPEELVQIFKEEEETWSGQRRKLSTKCSVVYQHHSTTPWGQCTVGWGGGGEIFNMKQFMFLCCIKGQCQGMGDWAQIRANFDFWPPWIKICLEVLWIFSSHCNLPFTVWEPRRDIFVF